jgi:hypothetical protein
LLTLALTNSVMLIFRTMMGGPFTSPDKVEAYMARDDLDDKEKGKRLYIEVSHAENSSLSFPKVSELFRLKKDHTNLPNQIYAQNLVAYLKRISRLFNMEMGDRPSHQMIKFSFLFKSCG